MNLKIIMLTKRKWETKDKLYDSIYIQLWKIKTIHSDRKQVNGCLGVGEGRERREKGITERPKETSWWWFHGHTRMLQGIRWWLQHGQFTVCQLFLNKAVTNTHSYTENQMPDDTCTTLLCMRNKSNKFNAT